VRAGEASPEEACPEPAEGRSVFRDSPPDFTALHQGYNVAGCPWTIPTNARNLYTVGRQ
jgi:hypothetical protein